MNRNTKYNQIYNFFPFMVSVFTSCLRGCCCYCLVAKSCLTLCNLWTVAYQASLSMGFLNKNTGVGCHFLLQGIFLTPGLSPHLLHWQADSLSLSDQGNPFKRIQIPKIISQRYFMFFSETLLTLIFKIVVHQELTFVYGVH